MTEEHAFLKDICRSVEAATNVTAHYTIHSSLQDEPLSFYFSYKDIEERFVLHSDIPRAASDREELHERLFKAAYIFRLAVITGKVKTGLSLSNDFIEDFPNLYE